jgi:peptide deformylase
MTSAERQQMDMLSMLIQHERDHQTYLRYVREINELMSRKEKRLADAERGAHAERSTEPK